MTAMDLIRIAVGLALALGALFCLGRAGMCRPRSDEPWGWGLATAVLLFASLAVIN